MAIDRYLERDLKFLCYDQSPIPQWRHGVLTFDGIEVRKIVAKKAENVAAILNKFEKLGWPKQITLPAEFNGDVLHQSLNSLNKGLKLMRFRADGSGTGVFWEITE